MTVENDYQPFATGAGANVITPSAYSTLTARQSGFQSGVASSAQLNIVWRQSSMIAAMIAQFISDTLDVNVLDDGNLTTLENNFKAALSTYSTPAAPLTALVHYGLDDSGSAGELVVPTISPTITAYQAGFVYEIVPANNCSGATTANIAGLGIRNVKRWNDSALVSGDYATGQPLFLVDDGTNLRIANFVISDILAILSGGEGVDIVSGDINLNYPGLTTENTLGSTDLFSFYSEADSHHRKTTLANLTAEIVTTTPSISPPRNLVAHTAAGSGNFTVPAGTNWIYYTVVGAGGGGAGAAGASTWSGGGGGSGGTAEGWLAVTPGQVIPYVVGAGGAGCAQGSGVTASTGGTSSFNTTIIATGGGGGQAGPTTCAGGNAGLGSGGQLNLYGAVGGDGNPSNAAIQGGAGAASSLGGGARTSTTAGNNGLAPGSAGGGIWENGTSAVGGTGADGAIIVEY